MYHVEFTEDVETLVENEASLIAEICLWTLVTIRICQALNPTILTAFQTEHFPD
jgi:hypothetical protein